MSLDRTDATVHLQSTSQAKIALFRLIFRGRDDVYARRFESRKTGKSGYAPACANEWIRAVCEKPRIKCADCSHQRFLPVTDDVIRWHLSGHDDAGQPFVAGIYPMLRDEACFFLAADFDKTGWREDASAFAETCRQLNLPAAIERSRSGQGGHVWLFFEEAIPAALARRLGSYILTETMERRPEVGLDSYDRFFPNQDTLPHGGFGNLIALPLQKQARGRDNSIFVDDELAPYPDQWAFLSTVRRIGRSRVEAIVRDAERTGKIVGVRFQPADEEGEEPWMTSPSHRRKLPAIAGLPRSLEVVLGNQIYVAKEALVPALRNQLVRLAAFQNPEFYKAQAMRLPTYDKPRIVACAEDHPKHIGLLPRGCLDDVLELLKDLKIVPIVRDERLAGVPMHATFEESSGLNRGSRRMRCWRTRPAYCPPRRHLERRSSPHGSSHSAASIRWFSFIGANCWTNGWSGCRYFWTYRRRESVKLAAGGIEPNGLLDVAVIQSLGRKGVVDDRVGGYGHLIVDECHHLSAYSFEQVARRAKARFVTGLSATVARKDGHHPIIFMQCGPIRHRVSAKMQATARPFEHTVIVRPTAFQAAYIDEDHRVQFQSLYRELIDDETRNRHICDDVIEAVRDGRSPLVLTERNDHLDRLANHLSGRIRHLLVLRGGMGKKQRQAVANQLETIPPDEERVLLSTGKYIGEGFDDARLDTLMLTLPVSWRGTIAQYAGRLHRLYDSKREVRVYDYADLNVPMLARMFDRRCRGYEP
jgi:hypothetical protein